MKSNVPGRTRQYIIDGTKIIVPRHLYESFEGAGLVKNKESALLLMDRKIDICMPLRRNSEITQFELELAERYNCWGPHPTHKNQKI